MNRSQEVGAAFLQQSRAHLTEDFMPKIRRCLEMLGEEDLWWRTHDSDNSIANLILHLCGNVRQWIISGVGGAPDHRERSREFSERNGISKDNLLKKLEGTVAEADRLLGELSTDQLLQTRTIQGFEKNCLQAIYHVVEHFAYHTGQIIYITKLRRGIDLKFYNL